MLTNSDINRQMNDLIISTTADKEFLLKNATGPAVPPKPIKKLQPLVPQSYPLKVNAIQPSYSSRLQQPSTLVYSNIPSTSSSLADYRVRSETCSSNIPKPQVPVAHRRIIDTSSANVTYANLSVDCQQDISYANLLAHNDDNNTGLPAAQLSTSDECPPPPSPVSSSYSELRRAIEPNRDFPNYSPHSASSTYESIYEPINPRQPSSISHYSLYTPYISGNCSTVNSGPNDSDNQILGKEHQVDTLTDLLVQGMHNTETDWDVYGICVKCNQKIIGENSGCTAMDKLYHIQCFTCHICATPLQGKPFYPLDGNAYCETDYMITLEKCCVCQMPIMDRILRATGKPYHPKCFCCVVCGKSLDGIPFTVDATNHVHCIEDFHKMFAPRCWVCKQPIMPEPNEDETVRVVALDHSFHIQCYKCEDCGLVLSSEAEGRGCYPLDGHVLCKSCNAKRVQALTYHMVTEL